MNTNIFNRSSKSRKQPPFSHRLGVFSLSLVQDLVSNTEFSQPQPCRTTMLSFLHAKSLRALLNYLVSCTIIPFSLSSHLYVSVSRVKKMIMLDADIQVCATSAAFTIAVATVCLQTGHQIGLPCKANGFTQEMFIQYMAEQGHNVVKSERKPRRNIQYRDLCMYTPASCLYCNHVQISVLATYLHSGKTPGSHMTFLNNTLPQYLSLLVSYLRILHLTLTIL
jgi:hypothetical protein